MPYESGRRSDRLKAMIAALAVTGGLGAILISGFDVETVRHAVERLQAIDISLPTIPPEEPPPRLQPDRALREEGAAGRKAKPTEVVAPEPKVEVPTRQEVAAAPVAGSGSASSAGAASSGNGTGAGGSGSGLGGGGSGAGNTPARLVRNLSRSDYRRLTGGRMAAGSAGLAIRVNTKGRVDSCRVDHSSGDPVIDSGLCPLVASRLRFEPARDARGRPIAYFTHYLARWRR